jgi:hypothetical protein
VFAGKAFVSATNALEAGTFSTFTTIYFTFFSSVGLGPCESQTVIPLFSVFQLLMLSSGHGLEALAALASSAARVPSGFSVRKTVTVPNFAQCEFNPKLCPDPRKGQVMRNSPLIMNDTVPLVSEVFFDRGIQTKHEEVFSSEASLDFSQKAVLVRPSIENFCDVIPIQEFELTVGYEITGLHEIAIQGQN